MTGKLIGYIRVSTSDQNPERQLEGMKLDKRFIDYASGKTTQRPQLEAMIDYIREDDQLYVHSMDRLARNVKDLRNLIDILITKGVSVHFVKENLSFTTERSPMNDLLLMVMGAIAEFELSMIRERQSEGIRIAKLAGKYKGRKRKLYSDGVEKINELLNTTRKSKSNIAKEMGISRSTLYKYLKTQPQGLICTN